MKKKKKYELYLFFSIRLTQHVEGGEQADGRVIIKKKYYKKKDSPRTLRVTHPAH